MKSARFGVVVGGFCGANRGAGFFARVTGGLGIVLALLNFMNILR